MQAQTLRTFPAPQVSQRRAAGAGLVIAMHVGLVVALAYGLNVAITPAEQVVPIDPDILIEKTTKPPLPPPVTPTQEDVRVKVIEPDIKIDAQPVEPGRTITASPDGQATQVSTFRPAVSIMGTHTRPPYPILAIRNGEVGTVTLRMTVSESGAVTDASVLRSSGYPRLDAVAIAWVKAHWKYQPATRDGRAVATTADANVDFKLN